MIGWAAARSAATLTSCRAAATLPHDGPALDGLDEHDPEGVRAAYLTAAAILQL